MVHVVQLLFGWIDEVTDAIIIIIMIIHFKPTQPALCFVPLNLHSVSYLKD